MGIQHVVVTYKTTMAFRTGMTPKPLAGMRTFIEHCLHVVMPATHRMDPKDLGQPFWPSISQKCILSTDFGQDLHPTSAEGRRISIATMLRPEMKGVEISMLVSDSPSLLMRTQIL